MEIYNHLDDLDLAFLYYLDGKNKQIKSSIINSENTDAIMQSLIIENNIRIFSTKFHKQYYHIRLIVLCLYKLDLVNRIKKDHSWNYSLTENGKKIISILNNDSKREKEVINILQLKEKKNRNA